MGSPGSFLKKISNFVLFILNSSFPTQNFSILSSFFLQLPFSDYMSHFICICNDGYYGDGHSFSDINECKVGSHDCSNNADCININGGFEFGTHEGYRGDGRIVFDIDECADGGDAFDINAECQNANGSYTCICDHGFHGDGRTCSDINQCYSRNDNCDENVSCSNTFGSYECVYNGFEGDG